MNPRGKNLWSFFCVLLCLIGSSRSRPSEDAPGDTETSTGTRNLQDIVGDKVPSQVVPQIGILERTDDASKAGKDVLPILIATPSSAGSVGPAPSAGNNGILVPVMSPVVEGPAGNAAPQAPLVALLPAPLPAGSPPASPSAFPALPVLQYEKPKREVRRSVKSENDEETMDVAEDIVFRPLFRIRQPQVRNSYSRGSGSNYRRYNVNGYYRLPSNYLRSDYRSRYDDE